ncbi:GTPase Era [Alphaproteobacteria bacterium]|nr:GTPase Era [Alphaproteobacteria bacterium]
MTSKILKIALVGRTNAGKSTLINRIVGEKISIQNKKINTTQVTIMGVKNIKKTQLIFYDTPGSNFLKSLNKDSRNLKTNLWSGIDESDIIFYLIDSKTANLKFLFEQIYKLQEVKKKIIILFNKIDLISNKQILPLISNLSKNFEIDSFFTISAIQNIGIEYLLDYIEKYSYLSKWVFKDDEITNKDDIFMVGELLRETMLTYLHKEIPYNVNIETSNFKILKNNDIKIKQKIIINELRYKKIILGRKGEMIKKIREDSQKKMSQILNAKIHLYLEILNA